MSLKGFISEILGTFFISLTLIDSYFIETNKYILQGLAVFFSVTSMSYTFVNLSGAHFNPVLSYSLVMTKKISLTTAVLNCVAQLIGTSAAFAAVFVGPFQKEIKDEYAIVNAFQMDDKRKVIAMFLEGISMLILVFVYNLVVDNPFSPKYIYGVCLGTVYLVNTMAFAFISGGCLNFLINLGYGLFYKNLDQVLYYFAGHLGGAIVGSVLSRLYMHQPNLEIKKDLRDVQKDPKLDEEQEEDIKVPKKVNSTKENLEEKDVLPEEPNEKPKQD
jgi:glycerol uptake facilitator-like aquaporin